MKKAKIAKCRTEARAEARLAAPIGVEWPTGMILERFKRLNGLPSHLLDLTSTFFVNHYLRRRRF